MVLNRQTFPISYSEMHELKVQEKPITDWVISPGRRRCWCWAPMTSFFGPLAGQAAELQLVASLPAWPTYDLRQRQLGHRGYPWQPDHARAWQPRSLSGAWQDCARNYGRSGGRRVPACSRICWRVSSRLSSFSITAASSVYVISACRRSSLICNRNNPILIQICKIMSCILIFLLIRQIIIKYVIIFTYFSIRWMVKYNFKSQNQQ
jgi:hypothetical protein